MITRLHCSWFKFFTSLLLLLKTTPLMADDALRIFDFSTAGTASQLQGTNFTKVERATDGLHLSLAPNSTGYLDLTPPDKRWDLRDWTRLVLDLDNTSTDATARLQMRAENDGATDWSDVAINDGFLHPGDQHRLFNLFFFRDWTDLKKYPALAVFKNMNGLPGGWMWHWRFIDPSKIRRVKIALTATDKPVTLALHSLTAENPVVPKLLTDLGETFFPFVDRFGQYAHDEWPGKVHNDDELHAIRNDEETDLAQHPRPANWDQYGGWKDGPQRDATGHFRTEKIDGRWWLVDPDGRLFWSHGVCCVGNETGATLITGRENYFAQLPPLDKSGNANFLTANLKLQFGDDWKAKTDDLATRRLPSWGMNTIGNWSDPAIERLHRLPYVREIHLWPPRISENLFDVFDPAWIETSKKVIDDSTREWKDDPWCIGFFVDNELGWEGSGRDFIAKLFAMRGDAFTKRLFIEALRKSMNDNIDTLNTALDTSFANWDAVLANKTKLKAIQIDKIGDVADAFFQKYVDTYFDFVGPTIKSIAPKKLYLGCRFNVTNEVATRSAARYCDVISFNLYRSDVSTFALPTGIDKPVLVSEFHFGALDRGQFHTGLQPASDQRDRADKYRFYVEGAMKNKIVVGTHWFEYATEPLTGRGDGENYNDGLVDVCGRVFGELRAAIRNSSNRLYKADQ